MTSEIFISITLTSTTLGTALQQQPRTQSQQLARGGAKGSHLLLDFAFVQHQQ